MYVLTGASGHIGRLVLQHLLTLVPVDQIIASTRTPQKLADVAAKGVEVRHADFTNPATLPAAFAGATRLLIISTDTIGQRAEQHRQAIEAAVTAGIHHITYTSGSEASVDASNLVQREHGLTEAALATSGVEWTALRNNFYAEILPYLISTLQSGDQLLIPEGQGKPAWITQEDCARTAAFVLANKTALAGPVEVTGPERLGLIDIAQRWSSISGRIVTAHVLPDHELVTQLIAKGVPEQSAAGAAGMAIGVTRDTPSALSDSVERATDTKASPIDVVLRSLVVASKRSLREQVDLSKYA